MVMAILDPGPQDLAAARFASRAGAAQEAVVLAALALLHTALELDEAVPGMLHLCFAWNQCSASRLPEASCRSLLLLGRERAWGDGVSLREGS